MISFNQIPPVTKNIILFCVFLFIASFLLENVGIHAEIVLGAYFPTSANFKIHQIISHMFMHGGFAHLAFNMYGLFAFGSAVEYRLGGRKFLILFFISGLGSYALFNLVEYYEYRNLIVVLDNYSIDKSTLDKYSKLQYIFRGDTYALINSKFRSFAEYIYQSGVPEEVIGGEKMAALFRANTIPMVGASGAIYGVLVGFAMIYSEVRLSIIFLPFLNLKAKYFVPLLILLDLYLGLQRPSWDPIAHFAHIGGALIGFLLMNQWKKDFFREN